MFSLFSFQSYQATVKTLYSSDWLRLFKITFKGEIGKRLSLIESQRKKGMKVRVGTSSRCPSRTKTVLLKCLPYRESKAAETNSRCLSYRGVR